MKILGFGSISSQALITWIALKAVLKSKEVCVTFSELKLKLKIRLIISMLSYYLLRGFMLTARLYSVNVSKNSSIQGEFS